MNPTEYLKPTFSGSRKWSTYVNSRKKINKNFLGRYALLNTGQFICLVEKCLMGILCAYSASPFVWALFIMLQTFLVSSVLCGSALWKFTLYYSSGRNTRNCSTSSYYLYTCSSIMLLKYLKYYMSLNTDWADTIGIFRLKNKQKLKVSFV